MHTGLFIILTIECRNEVGQVFFYRREITVLFCLFTLSDLLSHDEDAAGSLDPTLESLDPILPMTTTRSPTVTTYSGLASGSIFSVDDAEVDTDLSSLSAMTSSDVHGSGLLETSNLATLSSWGTGTSIFGAGGSLISDQGTPGLPQGRGSVRGNTAGLLTVLW